MALALQRDWLLSEGSAPVAEIGGKGRGLLELRDAGKAVPDFVILTTDAYRFACPEGTVPDRLPPEIEHSLDQAWRRLGGRPLAVRSSAVDEDSHERSFAGQMSTTLNVRSRPMLSDAVLECWRSLHSPRADAYRASSGAETSGSRLSIAVVIQTMLDPEVSGVAFTVDPIHGRADRLLVNAVWGLGEGLVQGELESDEFILDRSGLVVSQEIAEKPYRIARGEDGKTFRTAVEESRRSSATLAPGQLRELALHCLDIERRSGRPQDIEFALEGGRLYLLQTRPVTRFAARPQGERIVWDNSNIVESYAGLTLPLTFSFIRRAYRAVYSQLCDLMGMRPREVRRQEPLLSNMLGHLHGRVYYNLSNWYRLLGLFPGYGFTKRSLDLMLGVRDAETAGAARPRWTELPAALRALGRAIRLHGELPGLVRRFHADFRRTLERTSRVDLDRLPAAEALAAYHDLERNVLWRWRAPVANDLAAMVFYGLLTRLTVAWGVDPAGALHHAFMTGRGGMESTRVAEQLLAIAARLRADASRAARFERARPGEALAILREDPVAKAAFEEYLARYGDRAVEELKLESSVPRDDPGLCVAVLQSYVRVPPPLRRGPGPTAGVEDRLPGGLPGVLYRWLLERTRTALINRENQRIERTRAFGLARRIFRSVGRSFAEQGRLAAPEDVFYATVEELEDPPPDLRRRIAERRREFADYAAEPPLPDHFVTYGRPVRGPFPIFEESRGPSDLRGHGACPGIVTARCIVMERPDENVRLAGEILVARQTDPGWVVLFPSIGGLIVEHGSALSHSAIVAREMGIPAVVGVRGALRRLKTGDRVRLDGSLGTVTLLSDR